MRSPTTLLPASEPQSPITRGPAPCPIPGTCWADQPRATRATSANTPRVIRCAALTDSDAAASALTPIVTGSPLAQHRPGGAVRAHRLHSRPLTVLQTRSAANRVRLAAPAGQPVGAITSANCTDPDRRLGIEVAPFDAVGEARRPRNLRAQLARHHPRDSHHQHLLHGGQRVAALLLDDGHEQTRDHRPASRFLPARGPRRAIAADAAHRTIGTPPIGRPTTAPLYACLPPCPHRYTAAADSLGTSNRPSAGVAT